MVGRRRLVEQRLRKRLQTVRRDLKIRDVLNQRQAISLRRLRRTAKHLEVELHYHAQLEAERKKQAKLWGRLMGLVNMELRAHNERVSVLSDTINHLGEHITIIGDKLSSLTAFLRPYVDYDGEARINGRHAPSG